MKKQEVQPPQTEEDYILKIDGKEVHLTHQHKVYFPKDSITKGDLVQYYKRMAPFILPYVKDRPESLRRQPNGITDEGFFHKDIRDEAPEWVKTFSYYSSHHEGNINFIICNDTATLLYMVNLGCIEINTWFSRTEYLDDPDFCVIDIDPSPKNSFEEVIDAALAVKQVLDKAGCKGYPKTSGATGLHIYIPLGAKYTYKESEDFAHLIANYASELLPDTTSLVRNVSNRGPKIYLDFLQNIKGQTLAVPYCIRPKPGATASTPLDWSEVNHKLSPSQFTIHTLPERADSMGDIFKPVLGKGIDMMQALKRLEKN
jgi:bifunctional non-homologous end joining protein LigD